ncbi:hypothetical protein P4534_22700 [Peribacillus butanolivorans]|uniref:hypothetical protein n=1 Tax=Peribacillus butanolivorans TaxID=421767 RepID=UPI002E23E79B|nr:hypothetical protein [Peribacillus butanolivorans]
MKKKFKAFWQVASSKEILFFYFGSENDESGLGYGHTFASVLKPDQEGKFTLHFYLGVSEENPQVPFIVLSIEIRELKNYSFNAF